MTSKPLSREMREWLVYLAFFLVLLAASVFLLIRTNREEAARQPASMIGQIGQIWGER